MSTPIGEKNLFYQVRAGATDKAVTRLFGSAEPDETSTIPVSAKQIRDIVGNTATLFALRGLIDDEAAHGPAIGEVNVEN